MNDSLEELRRELSVEPSPEFAAKVRARIAREPKRRWAAMIVWSVAAAAATIVLGVVTQTPARKEARVASVSSAPIAGIPEAGPALPAEPVATAPTASRASATVAARGAVVSHERQVTFDVLVPDDQRLAIDRLLRDLNDGRIDPESLVSSGVDPLAELAPPPAIAVKLIDVPPIGGIDIKK